ncbi:MAG TPA: alpha/beta fold hydrolase [Solirubrobacteraceae bacterium]|jgi:triacylglycerol esterase/lipase EstA (alpha/beta hydrolase family)
MRTRLLTYLAIAAGCLAMSPVAASANPNYPVLYNGLLGYAHALTPDVPAAGSQYVTWNTSAAAASCHSASHPYPVVLVGGTWANQADDFAAVSPLLADNGYCVYTDNLGQTDYGDYLSQIGDIPTTATQLVTVVNKVLAATGAAKVDLVGHSQGGGVLPRWYLKYDGGASKVSVLVGLAPSNHGTTISGLQTLLDDLGLVGVADQGLNAAGFPAATEQEVGSQVNTELDQGGDTVPGVSYTTIVSRNDEVVTPYTHQFLTAGPGATVHNILLQSVCPLDQGEHLSVVYDHIALREMLNALDPATAQAPVCSPVLPIQGG